MNEAHKQGYHEQICGGEVGEKEKQSCSGAVERQNWRCSGGGEEQAEWSGLRWHLRPYDIWALMQPRSALISVTHLTTKGYVDGCLRLMLHKGPYLSEGPELLPRAMS